MPNITAGNNIRSLDTPETRYNSSTVTIAAFTNVGTFAQAPSMVGVTFIAPSTGRVKVNWSGHMEGSPAGLCHLSPHVRKGSRLGAGTSVSTSTMSSSINTGYNFNDRSSRIQASNVRLVDSLIAGNTYNAVLEWAMEFGGYGNIFVRTIMIQPVS